MNNITLLIHGPYGDNILELIYKNLSKSKLKVNKIIFVIYKFEKEKYLKVINLFKNYNIETVFIKDLINPGFANVNRQIYSVNEGLKLCEDKDFVVKLRNDQCVNFIKLFNIIKKYKLFLDTEDKKVLTTCSFSRKDRLYHPSDMFLCAYGKALKNYYKINLQKYTELDTKLRIRKLYEESNKTLKFNPISAESILFKNYIINNGWIIKNTQEDSHKAIKEFIYIINTWNIDLIWSKKRTNMFGENAIILPHYFTTAPFQGAPIEKHECYLQHEIFKTIPTLKDIFYINLSKFVWFMWTNNNDGLFKNLEEYDSKNISFLERIFSMFRNENRLIINILFFRIALKI